jgi:hypothetical protein
MTGSYDLELEAVEAFLNSLQGEDDATMPKQRKSRHNKAREERQAELRTLRSEVDDLEFAQERLQTIIRESRRRTCLMSSVHEVRGVWKDACIRQLEQRLRVERENAHLNKSIEQTAEIVDKIEKLLSGRPALRMMYPEARVVTRRVEMPPTDAMRPMVELIFEQLSASVEAAYHEVKRLDEENSSRLMTAPTNGPLVRVENEEGRIDVLDCTILPFGMVETSDAWWHEWHNYIGYDSTSDEVKEIFGMEISDSRNNTSATFYSQQILRRYVEDDRIVYVWSAYTEPFEFRKTRMHGVYYREQCHVLIKPVDPTGDTSTGTPCSRLLSTESITPVFMNSKLEEDAKIAALTKLIVKSMPPFIVTRNEAIESSLLDQELQKRRYFAGVR